MDVICGGAYTASKLGGKVLDVADGFDKIAFKVFDASAALDQSPILQNLGLIGSGAAETARNLFTVPEATERRADKSDDVGALYKFRVAPGDIAFIEKSMLKLIEVMKVDEYPDNETMTYTLYRDPAQPGTYTMYEHFSAKGAAKHSTTPGIYMLGFEQLDKMVAPYERYVLDPVIVKGCGEPLR